MKDVMFCILLLGLCAATAIMSVKSTRQTRLLSAKNTRIENLAHQVQMMAGAIQSQSNQLVQARNTIRGLETQRQSEHELAGQLRTKIAEQEATIEKAKAYVAALHAQMTSQRASIRQQNAVAAAAASSQPAAAAATRATPAATPTQKPPTQISGGPSMADPSRQGKLADGYYKTTDENGQTVLQRKKTHATGHKRDLDGQRIIKRLGE